MRQYGRTRHGGHPVQPGDVQPPTEGSAGRSPIPLLTDPGLAQLARLIEDNTRAVRELTVALDARAPLEITATIGDEVLRLQVQS